MRALVVACLAVCSAVVVAALAPSPASALVGGSWTGSCPGYSVHAFTIDAECRDINGVNVASTLNLLTCGQPATAGNADGRLVCESGPRRPPVPGSWSGSCGEERLAGRTLSAECIDTAGRKVSASLDLSTCNQPASAGNQNGRLVCESGLAQAMSPPPPPTSRTTILHMDPPSAAGSAQTQTLPLRMPVPVIVLPAPGQAASASPSFGGAWNITTNAGEHFTLAFNQNGAAVTGSADIRETHVTFSGTAFGRRLDATWLIGTPSGGRLTGAGTFDLSADGSQLTATIEVGGQAANNGTWVGVRGNSTSSVVMAPAGAANLPAVTAGNSGNGLVRATVKSAVSIRTAPTMNGSDILGTLTRGTEVIVQCQKSWCALSTGQGFVSKGFLTLHGPATSTDTGASTGAAMPSNETRVVVGQVTPPAATAAPPVAIDPFIGPGCHQRPQAKSVDLGGAKITLMFHNASSGVRRLLWINRDGDEVAYHTLQPGTTVPQETFNGHVWEMTNENGQCTLLFTAGTTGQTLETQ